MSEGLAPWIQHDEPETREVLAAGVLRDMQSLLEHPGWHRMCRVLDQKITAGRDALEWNEREEQQIRGALKALRNIKALPAQTIKRATDELSNYRGD